MRHQIKYYTAFLLGAFLLSACHKDLRTSLIKKGAEQNLEEKGNALLAEAYQAHGMDDFKQHQNYEVDAKFKFHFPFRSMMNMDPFKVGPKDDIRLRYAVNSFDGQMEYMNGNRKGDIYGTQSFKNYKLLAGEEAKFFKREQERRAWGVTAYHYLLEIPMRIQKANIVKYAGKETYNGVEYDKVFATWDIEKANKNYDHWILYIHPETKRIDLLKTTIKEYYMPIPGFMYATVLFQDYQKVGGNLIMPSRFVFQMFNPKKKDSKFIYDIKFQNYQFDSFDIEKLYPNKELERFGDSKPSLVSNK